VGLLDQRFYASTYGRFNTPDPYGGSAGPSDPGSWNRYSYVQGDPANRNDRTGLFSEGSPCGDYYCMDEGTASVWSGGQYSTYGLTSGGFDPCTQLIFSFGAPTNVNCTSVTTSAFPGDSKDEPPEPECDIKVQHFAIPGTGKLFVHSYLTVTGRDGNSSVLEADETALEGGFIVAKRSATGIFRGEDPLRNAIDFDAKRSTNRLLKN
jgi:hypothetical protein